MSGGKHKKEKSNKKNDCKTIAKKQKRLQKIKRGYAMIKIGDDKTHHHTSTCTCNEYKVFT